MICHKVRDKSWSCYKVGTSLGDVTRLGQVLELLQGWGKSWRCDKVGTSLGAATRLGQVLEMGQGWDKYWRCDKVGARVGERMHVEVETQV